MNSVSWFLYLTEVVSNVRGIANTAVFAIPLAAVFSLCLSPLLMIAKDELDIDPLDYVRPAAKTAGIVWSVALVFYLFAPSQNTMYAIAASEVGEKIVKSEAAQEMASDATKALQQWIKRQIEPEAKK